MRILRTSNSINIFDWALNGRHLTDTPWDGEITGYRTTSVHGRHGQPWALVARLVRWNRKAKTVTVEIKQLNMFLRIGTMSLSKREVSSRG